MSSLIFEWDPEKAALNLAKHSVAFAEAATVFTNPIARILDDPDHSETEHRELIIGASADNRLLIVAFVERDDAIRIISARTVTTRERKDYEAHITRQS